MKGWGWQNPLIKTGVCTLQNPIGMLKIGLQTLGLKPYLVLLDDSSGMLRQASTFDIIIGLPQQSLVNMFLKRIHANSSKRASRDELSTVNLFWYNHSRTFGTFSRPLAIHIRGHIKCSIKVCYKYDPTVNSRGHPLALVTEA